MNLTYAVDRLYDSGWQPEEDSADAPLERLPDARLYPSVPAVVREFAEAGFALTVRHTPAFNCYRATWAPAGEQLDEKHAADESHGTVIGTCQREAAVYALAQHREMQGVTRMAMA